MSDLVLNSITSGYNLSLINSNFQAIQDKINNFCLQTSQGDNVMSQALDMNGYSILNTTTDFSNNGSMLTVGDAKSHFYQIGLVPSTTNNTDAVNYGQVSQMIEAASAGTDPANVALYGVLSSTAVGSGASLIGVEDSGGLYTSATTESALAEVMAKVNSNKSDLASTADDTKGSGLIGYIQNLVGSVATTLTKRLRNEVYASDFGAKGDGVTDDSAALQAAINACQDASGNGRVLILNDGQYLVSVGLVSTGTLVVKSRGKHGSKIITNSAIDIFTGEVSKIYGIVFSHNGSSGSCIKVSGDKAVVEDNYFSPSAANTSPAVWLTGSNQTVEKNGFTSRNANAFCVRVSYNGSLCINNRIFGNTMYGNGKGIAVSQDTTGGRPEGLSILDNKIILTGQQHILLQTCLSVTISDNVIDQSSGYGIHLNPISPGVDGILVQGNYIATATATSTGNGIGITTGTGGVRGLTIRGNMFYQCAWAIALDSQVSLASIIGNYFDIITTNSVKINGSTNVTISSNIFRGANAHLALVDGASGGPVSVIGNQISSSGSVTYTPTDSSKFHFDGNQGIKLSGQSSALVNVTTGTNTFVNVPHGLAAAPDAGKVIISLSRAGGALNNPCAIVSSIDSTNIVVNLFWSGIVTQGNIRVNARASL